MRSLVEQHIKRDAKFSEALRLGGIDTILSGDRGTGKAILRDDIKAKVIRSPH